MCIRDSLSRTWPFWTGSKRVIVFKDEEELDANTENGTDLVNFLREQLSGTTFPDALLSEWCGDVIHWRMHVTERHHSIIHVQTLLESRKAFIVSFDVRSLQSLFKDYAQVLETYRIGARRVEQDCFLSEVEMEACGCAMLVGLHVGAGRKCKIIWSFG